MPGSSIIGYKNAMNSKAKQGTYFALINTNNVINASSIMSKVGYLLIYIVQGSYKGQSGHILEKKTYKEGYG